MTWEIEDHDRLTQVSQRLKILSVETRLRMLLLLGERNLCVGALACQLGVTQGAASQHLKILRDAGLVTAERDGYYVHYRVDEGAVAQMQHELDRMLEWVRKGRPGETFGSESPSEHCSKRKESPCARKKRETVAGRGAM